jgi:hypothetical protein
VGEFFMGLVKMVEAQNSGLQQNAVIVTTSENMFLVVKELIRQVRCNLITHTNSIEVALQYIAQGKRLYLSSMMETKNRLAQPFAKLFLIPSDN